MTEYRFDIDEAQPLLYIFMRSDMTSLNPGKAMAQASHAANAMVHVAGVREEKRVKQLLAKWQNETPQGFGTCIVLDLHDEKTIEHTINYLEILAASDEVVAQVINDPTYPVTDGEITHLLSVNTCGYALIDGNNPYLREILREFPLYA